jgi:hypothetical protein
MRSTCAQPLAGIDDSEAEHVSCQRLAGLPDDEARWIVPLVIATKGPLTPRTVQVLGGSSSVISSVPANFRGPTRRVCRTPPIAAPPSGGSIRTSESPASLLGDRPVGRP